MPDRSLYTVSAACGDAARTATRRERSSAMVLADRWAEDGCRNVRIADSAGIVREREAFRATLPGIRTLRPQPVLH
ncbi:hypothetical protein Q8W71_13760 [Methylobacterium sp. NEAU 140]|uniref:hypothetical protein n=1 Tax=Methylobacterium sp. NEAU 140 TaxID=3064945 RepID=UPI002736DB0A|nr:hypothetical protein [Methylobacterium sp. NEAU 140]MDP4023698.1 hypothetical protein [Methylobacterium sp. NEAU 140]